MSPQWQGRTRTPRRFGIVSYYGDYQQNDKEDEACTIDGIESLTPLGPIPRDRPIVRRDFRCFCCLCPPCVWIPCGIFITLIAVLVVVLGSISWSNAQECKRLNVDDIPPTVHTADLTKFSEFVVSVTGNFPDSEIWISQSNSTTATLASLEIRLASPSSVETGFSQTTNDNQYIISLTQAPYNPPFSYWNLPPKCSKSRVTLILPQQIPDNINTTVTTNYGDITFLENHIRYYNLTLNATTSRGSINLQNFSSQSLILGTENGPITGSIASLSKKLSAYSTNGDVDLAVNLISNATSPNINADANNGNVRLQFDHTFSGNFTINTTNGHISTANSSNENSQNNNERTGTVTGAAQGSLSVKTTNGDANLTF